LELIAQIEISGNRGEAMQLEKYIKVESRSLIELIIQKQNNAGYIEKANSLAR
jgi:hypothetical protein